MFTLILQFPILFSFMYEVLLHDTLIIETLVSYFLVLTFHLLWIYLMLQDVMFTHTARIVYIVVTVVVVYSVITWPEPVQTDVTRVYTEKNVTWVMWRLSFHSAKGSVPLTLNYAVFNELHLLNETTEDTFTRTSA